MKDSMKVVSIGFGMALALLLCRPASAVQCNWACVSPDGAVQFNNPGCVGEPGTSPGQTCETREFPYGVSCVIETNNGEEKQGLCDYRPQPR